MRSRVLFPQSRMAEDAFHDVGFVNQAYDLHVMAASGTSQGIHLPERVEKVPLIVTPAQAGVQENLERPGFPLSRE